MTPLEKWSGTKPSIKRLRVLGSKTYKQFDKTEIAGKYGAKGWMGVQVGYSEGTPGYRVWDPTTHLVWDVRVPEFNEEVTAGWWKKPVTVKENIGDSDEPLFFQGLEEEEKDKDEGVIAPTGGDQCVRGVAEDEGPPGVEGGVPPKGGEGSQEQEGALEPRRTGRENRGVPPLRFAEMLLEDVRTDYMAADMLTKSVGPAILAVDMKLIGMNVKSG